MRAGAIDKKTLSVVNDSINYLFGEIAGSWSQRYESGSVLIQDGDSGERFTITFDAESSKTLITVSDNPGGIIA